MLYEEQRSSTRGLTECSLSYWPTVDAESPIHAKRNACSDESAREAVQSLIFRELNRFVSPLLDVMRSPDLAVAQAAS